MVVLPITNATMGAPASIFFLILVGGREPATRGRNPTGNGVKKRRRPARIRKKFVLIEAATPHSANYTCIGTAGTSSKTPAGKGLLIMLAPPPATRTLA